VALTLALLEALVLFGAACARLFVKDHGAADFRSVGAQALAFTLCALFAFHFNDFYDLRCVRSFRQFVARLPRTIAMMLLLVGVARLAPSLRIAWWSLAELVVVIVMVLLPLRALVHYLFTTHPFSRRVLVLGTTEFAGKLVRELLAEPDLRDVVVGVVDDGSGAFKPSLPCLRLGRINDLGKIVDGFEPDLIVCALAERHDPVLMRDLLTPRARRVPIEDGLVAYERLTGKIAIEYATPRAFLFSQSVQASWITLLFARSVSAVVAACGILVLSPLLLPIALLIKLDSDGPVFFLQERIGLGGRLFNLIKFRTMRPGATLSQWVVDNDHRMTRVGYWLRRFRVDEAPQFVNILRGDMNLVGPRPHPASNAELFTDNIPYYGVRCSVRPGVTGWAQIRYGYANDLQEETEKMRYDLHYIKNMSVGLDLRILFETVKVVLKGGRSATLVDQAGIPVAPIYFGIEHPRNRREPDSVSGLAPALAKPLSAVASTASLHGSKDGVVSIEERRSKGPRASRGIA
jgi:exopolysaccharide biosynthesis polyprenyl glycosylphosphotransferase